MDRTSPEWKAYKTAYDKARYEKVRDKKVASAKKWYEENKEAKQEYDDNYKPVKNLRRRTRYANDESYRIEMNKATGKGARRRNLKQYGLTHESFDAMLSSQNNRCACCKVGSPGGSGSWCVDHDHVTGLVRGLVCIRCNTGIGVLGDTIEGVANAMAYLRRHHDLTVDMVDEHY